PTAAPAPAPVAAPVQPVAAPVPKPTPPPAPPVDRPVISASSISPTVASLPTALTYTRQPSFGPSTPTADAFINLGSQPYAQASGLTVGDARPCFIDKLNYASNPDQLSWAVAHNVAHELMHAFGVADHPDQTGKYLDAAAADWKMLTDPNTTFSPAAVELLKTLSNGASSGTVGAEMLKTGLLAAQCHCNFCDTMTGMGIDGAQVLAAAVPEPATGVHGLRSNGWAPLPERGPAILIANHTCCIDHLLLQARSRRVLGFMIAKEMYELPIVHAFCVLTGGIPVKRDGRDRQATRAALR
ncbi:hypothetical protein HK102_012284, partial [Quaeritorhiza haematococci]